MKLAHWIKVFYMHLKQRTLTKAATCSGVGVHSGKNVNLTIKPAPVNHGIRFIRTDLPDNPGVSALFKKVVDTSLATVIGDEGLIISTIEHLMACFAGMSIDNAVVELDSYEVPIMDGSALPFVSMILDAGIKEQIGPKFCIKVNKPIELKENGKSVSIYPCPEYRITCTISYDHPLIKTQTYTLSVNEKAFKNEICGARTFGFLQEYEMMKKYGLGIGCSMDNVIVIDKDTVVNKEGLRYDDEFVRHKVLDCLGDFSLLGMPLMGHIVANKSGHFFNHAFLNNFFAHKKSWETIAIK